jgi:predicted phage-related endonuclease
MEALQYYLEVTDLSRCSIYLRDAPQLSPAWHDRKRFMITASDVGTVLGHSEFNRTPQHVIAQKINHVNQAPTPAQAAGLAAEPELVQKAKELLRKQKKPVQQCTITGLWTHPQHCWLGASPDRILTFKDGEKALLEVKQRSYDKGLDIPQGMRLQVRWPACHQPDAFSILRGAHC